MILISTSGKSGHGKDFCARLIRDIAAGEYSAVTAHFAFAWPLKMRVFGEDPSLTWDDLATKPPHVRKLLQEVGTERGRNVFGTEFWTRQADAYLRLLGEAMPEVEIVTNADTRFPNEVDFIRQRGLALWVQSDRPTLTGAAAQHPSETALDGLDKTTAFDGVIVNNMDTTIDDLHVQLAPFVHQAMRRAIRDVNPLRVSA